MSNWNYDGRCELDYLRETGLLWYINTMLHPFGLAIAIKYSDDKLAQGLMLLSTPDKDGIVFDDLQYQAGRQKFIDWFVNQEDK